MSMNQLKKKYNYEWHKIRHKCKSEEVGSKREGVGANTHKKDIGRRACNQGSDVTHTNCSMYFFK